MAKKEERKITGTISSSYPKKLVPGSMATQSKMVENKPKKKASTKYSPAPMSVAAKKKMAENANPFSRSLRKNLKPLNLDKMAKAKKK